MVHAKIVVGAGFGDEGKGLMTDYFCSKYPKDQKVLNVRFNGGAQAGHTVCDNKVRRAVFGHFGAGSFLPNVCTYLGPEFIVNPILFRQEWMKLRRMGVTPVVYMHPRCLLTIPQDMMINQIVEKWRGRERHGSCGVGIYETLFRSKINRQLHVGDDYVSKSYKNMIIQDYSEWHLSDLGVACLSSEDKALLTNRNIVDHYDDDLSFLRSHVILKDESILDEFENVVFEGAQGLMLDQNNKDYFPHLTPANTGMANVDKLLRGCHFGPGGADVETCYVTRTYLTRHGAGRFDTECPRQLLPGVQIDTTNHFNEFQQDFRYGFYDVDAVQNAIQNDCEKNGSFWLAGWRVSRAFTHMDETNGHVCVRGYTVPLADIVPSSVCTYVSYGPTRQDVGTL